MKALANPESVAGMARYGINPESAYGVSIPNLRKIAREFGENHELALKLWASGIHEARILAAMVERPADVTEEQMEAWVRDFNSWDLCDQCCNNLFRKLAWAYDKAAVWTSQEEEFVKRAGFVLMACLAVHDKKVEDAVFERLLVIIKKEASDNRNFVKKAVNGAPADRKTEPESEPGRNPDGRGNQRHGLKVRTVDRCRCDSGTRGREGAGAFTNCYEYGSVMRIRPAGMIPALFKNLR